MPVKTKQPPVKRRPTPRPKAQNPYVGPRTFEREEADRFFGREREARELLALVIAERLVLFYAQSGAGKSSLIKTRLIPGLEQKGFEVLPIGRVSGMKLPMEQTATGNPFVFNLLLSLEQGAADPMHFVTMKLPEFLPNLLYQDARYLYTDQDQGTLTVEQQDQVQIQGADLFVPRALILDQFEEILTTEVQTHDKRTDFFDQLRQAMEADPYLWVVLVMRADYIAGLDPYAHRLPGGLRARYSMARMDYTAALAAIREPAAQAKPYPRQFAEGVAERLVTDLSRMRVLGETEMQPGQYVEPVQLQVVCYQLWEKLAQEKPWQAGNEVANTITAQDLERLGNVDRALADFYEQALQVVLQANGALAGVDEFTLRDWFEQQLITEAGTRNAVYQGKTQTADLPNEVVRRLANQFLVRVELRAGGAWVELVHDRFIDPILQSNQEWQVQHPLIMAARTWESAPEPKGYLLYQGRQLAVALQQPDAQRPLVRVFLHASQEVEQEQNAKLQAEQQAHINRILRIGIALLLILALLALGFAISANGERRSAKEQQATAEAASTRASQQQVIAESASLRAGQQQAMAEAASVRASQQQAVAEAAADVSKRSAEARQLAAQAIELVRQGNSAEALVNALKAVTTTWVSTPNTKKFIEPLGYNALLQAITDVQPLRAILHVAGENARFTQYNRAGSHLLTVSRGYAVQLWDAEQRTALLTLGADALHSEIRSAALSPDDTLLIVGGEDATLQIWQIHHVNNGITATQALTLTEHSLPFNSIAFSADGAHFVTASDDQIARVWALHRASAVISATAVLTLTGHTAKVNTATFSPDGTRLVTASDDQTARLWQLKTAGASMSATLLLELNGHTGAVNAAAFNPDGTQIVTASSDRTARVWDLASGNVQLITGHQSYVLSAAFSPDGARIVTASDDKTARVWDAKRGVPLLLLSGHTSAVNSAAFSPNGMRVVTASEDGTARVWDTMLGRLENQDAVSYAVYSPDGNALATIGSDLLVRIWNVQSGAQQQTLQGHTKAIRAVAFSQDGQRLVTASDDKTARIWDVATGQELRQLLGHSKRVNSAVFAPDNLRIVTASNDNTARVWDAVTGAEQLQLDHADYVIFATFSPNGQWLVSASKDGIARLWDARRGIELQELEGHTASVQYAAFSPDNKLIVTASDDQTIRLWPVDRCLVSRSRCKATTVLTGHLDTVTMATFSNHDGGKQIVSASWDGTVRLWAVESGIQLLQLGDQSSKFNTASFSRNDQCIVSASDNGTVRTWVVDVDTLLAMAGALHAQAGQMDTHDEPSCFLRARE